MSMSLYMGLQCAFVFLAYIFITAGLPALAFGPLFKQRRLSERFVIYYTIGNFFVINLVLILQLLKISNRTTLTLLLLVVAIEVGFKLHGKSVVKTLSFGWLCFDRLLGGQLGMKTAAYRSARMLRLYLGDRIRKWGSIIKHNFLEICLLSAFVLYFLWFYGVDVVKNFGYEASDMPVHTYWINYLSRKQVFVDGVYPFGMHCMVYFLHEVLGIDVYIALRVFCVTQNFMVIMMMICLLKYCCKTKYTPYIALIVYNIAECLGAHTYSRFYPTLPQEFGMIFIYPTIYFAFAFFKERREKRPSFWCLAGFAMSFSMTLAIHFYDTMIAGLFCVGIAVGYFTRFIKWEYFRRVVLTCVVSVMIAVLPMLIAFLTGTPLQGSLNWGMSVMKGEEWEGGEQGDDGQNEGNEGDGQNEGNQGDGQNEGNQGDGQNEGNQGDSQQGEGEDDDKVEIKLSLGERIKRKVVQLKSAAIQCTKDLVLVHVSEGTIILFYLAVVFLMLAGVVLQILKHPDYGGILLSTGMYVIVMLILLLSKELGLPPLMDAARASIYFAYAVPLVAVFVPDTIIATLFYPLRNTKFRRVSCVFSLFSLCGLLGCVVWSGAIRQPIEHKGMQSNEAITCLTNIILEEEDFRWTIVSANDERQMGLDHGYHYGIIDFLRKMEVAGDRAMLTLQTHTVYFFVEKRPVTPVTHYDNGVGYITEQDAVKPLPQGGSMYSVYDGEPRWIVMARMYYWAQEFMRLYPKEISVFMENDNFVCYKVTQNPASLYNFAIDYGFNMQTIDEENDEMIENNE